MKFLATCLLLQTFVAIKLQGEGDDNVVICKEHFDELLGIEAQFKQTMNSIKLGCMTHSGSSSNT